jgi:hypothetical protein
VFLDTAPRARSAAALTELVQSGPVLTLGAEAARLLRRTGGDDPGLDTRGGLAHLGLSLSLPRSAFVQLGAFDFADSPWPGLACADMALKADMMGLPRQTWREPAAGETIEGEGAEPARSVEPGPLIQSLIDFRTRWCRTAAAA